MKNKELIEKMTLEEKVGQMLTSLGWPMYERVGEEIRLTARLEKEISEYHIGALWGFMRADPWTQRTLHTGLNPSLAARASNRLQAFVMEHSRLGIPLFLAEECPHGHMAIGTTVFPTSIGQASTWNPELIRQMDEIKPAHLTFDIVGAFRPIGIENKVEVSLYRLKIRSRFANTRGQRVVRFDGEADFDGSILFNQFFRGITFPAISIRTGFPIREDVNATVTIDSWYAFDGTTVFDGSRKFNVQIVQEEI